MRKLLSIALCLPLAACVIGDVDPGAGGGGGDDQTGGGTGGGTNDGSLTGLITADATWSGTVLIGLDRTTTQIEPNVTITVSPGTQIKFKPGAGLVIKGTLKVEGTSAGKVILDPADSNNWSLIVNGVLDMKYAVMTRGSIQTSAGSTTTIADTLMSKAGGDLLIPGGGTVTMTYSQIGIDLNDTTHCQVHTSGDALAISVTRSNIIGAPFGLMLYHRGAIADFKNNNWYSNETNISTQPGANGDVSGGYFEGGAPIAGGGATLTAGNLSATRLTDAGVRP